MDQEKMIIQFPKDIGQKYYMAHYRYLLNFLKYMNLNIKLYDPESHPGGFIIRINEKRVLIDFADSSRLVEKDDKFDTCFKYQYPIDCQAEHIHPIGTISFWDWKDYFVWGKQIKYRCNADHVLNNQRILKGARYRRSYVREMLKNKYGDLLDFAKTDRWAFWKKINNCLVSICVPGQREDILDRGQFQYMAFGACTISPRLNIVLPYMRKVEPGLHYVECATNYSNLIGKIEWCRNHRAECIQIGQNARNLFLETSIPSALWQWMSLKINGGKK